MKIQTTIEFIIILVAISSLILVVLSIYNGISSDTMATFNAILNHEINQSNSTSNVNNSSAFEISYYLNRTLPLDIPTLGYIEIVSQVPITILNLSDSSDNGYLELNKGLKNTMMTGFSIDKFYYTPNKTGPATITFNFKIRDKNNTSYKNLSMNVSIYKLLQYGKKDYNASINIYNSSATYPIKNQDKIYNFSIKTHCSTVSDGVELPINIQCGDASYDLFIFSNYCFYDHDAESRVICIYKDYHNSLLLNIGNNASSLSYDGKFKLFTTNISIYSDFSSSNHGNSTLQSLNYPGRYYGNLELLGAQGIIQNHNNELLYMNGSLWYVNSSASEEFYVQKNEINSLLKFYNGTGIDGKQWEYLSENINAYNKSIPKSSQLFDQVNCKFNPNLNYTCADVPIKFSNITAEIKNYSIKNGTVVYKNYTINIR